MSSSASGWCPFNKTQLESCVDLLRGRQKERGRNEKRTSETFCTAERRVTSPHAKHRRRPIAGYATPPKIKGKGNKERPKSLDRAVRVLLASRMGMGWTVTAKRSSQCWMETSGWQGLRSELHEGGGGVTQVPERRPPPQGQRESEKAALESRGHRAKYLKKQIAKEQMLFFFFQRTIGTIFQGQ